MKPHSPSIGPLLASGSARQLSPENTRHLYNIYTMLDQRRRRWADIVWMLYKCFVILLGPAPALRRVDNVALISLDDYKMTLHNCHLMNYHIAYSVLR